MNVGRCTGRQEALRDGRVTVVSGSVEWRRVVYSAAVDATSGFDQQLDDVVVGRFGCDVKRGPVPLLATVDFNFVLEKQFDNLKERHHIILFYIIFNC